MWPISNESGPPQLTQAHLRASLSLAPQRGQAKATPTASIGSSSRPSQAWHSVFMKPGWDIQNKDAEFEQQKAIPQCTRFECHCVYSANDMCGGMNPLTAAAGSGLSMARPAATGYPSTRRHEYNKNRLHMRIPYAPLTHPAINLQGAVFKIEADHVSAL